MKQKRDSPCRCGSRVSPCRPRGSRPCAGLRQRAKKRDGRRPGQTREAREARRKTEENRSAVGVGVTARGTAALRGLGPRARLGDPPEPRPHAQAKHRHAFIGKEVLECGGVLAPTFETKCGGRRAEKDEAGGSGAARQKKGTRREGGRRGKQKTENRKKNSVEGKGKGKGTRQRDEAKGRGERAGGARARRPAGT